MLQFCFVQWFNFVRWAITLVFEAPELLRLQVHQLALVAVSLSAPGRDLATAPSRPDDFVICNMALISFGSLLFFLGFACGKWRVQTRGGEGDLVPQLGVLATTSAGKPRTTTPPTTLRSFATPSPLRALQSPLSPSRRRLECLVPLTSQSALRSAPEAKHTE